MILSARYDSDEFQPILIGDGPFNPFTLMQRDAIMLDQDRARMQRVLLRQLCDRLSSAGVGLLSI
ncbi:MAG: hypothetical protein AVDCRST_MAG42-2713 [uncultured Chthoniobacterales bacterium]|uniref:Uncharacterized protein n=1 Tax=uncultured Chthoniobacterales bacterium TaxID=1836801 RepID=A0A6J4IML8_9BACT|nr:MAG: hypothetical protein AVDCRST_MAG42-2713 [uncultured Chthoniobacterales bacterium]